MPCILSKNVETGVVVWFKFFCGFGGDLWINKSVEDMFVLRQRRRSIPRDSQDTLLDYLGQVPQGLKRRMNLVQENFVDGVVFVPVVSTAARIVGETRPIKFYFSFVFVFVYACSRQNFTCDQNCGAVAH